MGPCPQTPGFIASCCPRPKPKTGGASLARPQPGPAPESALSCIPAEPTLRPVNTSVPKPGSPASPANPRPKQKGDHHAAECRLRKPHFQAHLALESRPVSRLIPHWNQTSISGSLSDWKMLSITLAGAYTFPGCLHDERTWVKDTVKVKGQKCFASRSVLLRQIGVVAHSVRARRTFDF